MSPFGADMLDNPKLIETGVLIDDKYKVVRILGQGGMSTVYLAEQIATGRTVAVKVLRHNLGAVSTKRFLREARLLTRLEHPHILRARAFGAPDNGAPYLVLEYLQGSSLQTEILERGALQWKEAVVVFNQILAGVAYAHSRGVIHRDLKPANIMIEASNGDESWRVRILDFGVAGFVDSNVEQKLTQTGNVIGTPAYMAPELCEGQRATKQSDIYSLGCVLYEICCGVPPFSAETVFGVLYKHAKEEASFEPRDAEAPNAVATIVHKCLRKNPSERYETVEEIMSDFDRACRGLPLEGIPNSVVHRKKQLMRAAIPALVGLCIVLILGCGWTMAQKLSLVTSSQPPKQSGLSARGSTFKNWYQSLLGPSPEQVRAELKLSEEEVEVAQHECRRIMDAQMRYAAGSEADAIADEILAAQYYWAAAKRKDDPQSFEHFKTAIERIKNAIRRLEFGPPQTSNRVMVTLRAKYAGFVFELLSNSRVRISDEIFRDYYGQGDFNSDWVIGNRSWLREHGGFGIGQLVLLYEWKAQTNALKALRFSDPACAKEALAVMHEAKLLSKDSVPATIFSDFAPDRRARLEMLARGASSH